MSNERQRPETGPMCFGDDWPGTFIRGDNAFGYALALEAAIKGLSPAWKDSNAFTEINLEGLLDVLRSSKVGDQGEFETQQLKSFTECKKE